MYFCMLSVQGLMACVTLRPIVSGKGNGQSSGILREYMVSCEKYESKKTASIFRRLRSTENIIDMTASGTAAQLRRFTATAAPAEDSAGLTISILSLRTYTENKGIFNFRAISLAMRQRFFRTESKQREAQSEDNFLPAVPPALSG